MHEFVQASWGVDASASTRLQPKNLSAAAPARLALRKIMYSRTHDRAMSTLQHAEMAMRAVRAASLVDGAPSSQQGFGVSMRILMPHSQSLSRSSHR